MVFIFLILFLVSIIFLRLKIQIKNLQFETSKESFFNDNFIISVTLFLLGYVPIFKIKITKDKIKKMNISKKVKSTNIKKQLNKEKIKILKVLTPQIKKLDLEIKFGTENAAYTAYIYSILKTFFINILKRNIEVEAVFNNKNQLKVYLDGIFELKLIHIINKLIIYNKRRGYNNERTSNRRTYAFSNE